MSALVTGDRKLHEMAKYSPYGVPFGLPGGDADSDGDNDAADASQIQAWIDGSTYDVRGDVDLDGDVDINDKNLAGGLVGTLGWRQLSSVPVLNDVGFAGYVCLTSNRDVMHIRERAYESELGRWIERDYFLGYGDGNNLVEYVKSAPLGYVDPMGLQTQLAIESARQRCQGATAGRDSCDFYLPCDNFLGSDQACVCRCVSETPGNNRIRGCLQCMARLGIDSMSRHIACQAFPPSFEIAFLCVSMLEHVSVGTSPPPRWIRNPPGPSLWADNSRTNPEQWRTGYILSRRR